MSGDRLRKRIDRLRKQVEKAERGRAPLMAPDFSGIPEEDRAILQAAAKGDKVALVKAQACLADPKHIQTWGDPMYAARCWLVYQVSGDDLVVARTTHARTRQLREDFGDEKANTLEKVAITRVVQKLAGGGGAGLGGVPVHRGQQGAGGTCRRA